MRTCGFLNGVYVFSAEECLPLSFPCGVSFSLPARDLFFLVSGVDLCVFCWELLQLSCWEVRPFVWVGHPDVGLEVLPRVCWEVLPVCWEVLHVCCEVLPVGLAVLLLCSEVLLLCEEGLPHAVCAVRRGGLHVSRRR